MRYMDMSKQKKTTRKAKPPTPTGKRTKTKVKVNKKAAREVAREPSVLGE